MRQIKSFKMVLSLVFIGLGTMAFAQSGVTVAPVKSTSTANNPNYNSNYNVPTNGHPDNSPNGFDYGMDINALDASSSAAQQQRLKAAEEYRKLNEAMDKLMLLTKQLKTGIDSQIEGQIPPDLIKKAGEIEKLAKSIQSQQKS